jgi:hypothetical protein
MQAMDTAIQASGWLIPASDTGQVDLTTVARPSVGVYAGYKVYKANDALQATKPFFLKVEFGVSAGSVTRWLFRFTVANITNGAGTLSGITTNFTPTAANADGSGVSSMWGSGTANSAWILFRDAGVVAQDFSFCFGRSHDAVLGAPDGDSICYYGYSSGNSMTTFANHGWTDFSAAWGTFGGGYPALFPAPGANFNSGPSVTISKIFMGFLYRNGKVHALPMMVARSSDVPWTNSTDSAFSLNVWGGTYTFLPAMYWASPVDVLTKFCLPWG